MIDIVKLLGENKDTDGYRVICSKSESYELFFVHRELETVRATDTTQLSVTAYVDHDGKKGDSTFAVYESMSEDEVRSKIKQAADRARLVFNEPYDLVEGGTLQAELESNLKEEEPRILAAKIADAVFSADCGKGGSINATEIFLYRDTVRVINSRGVDKTQIKYRGMIEAIPTYTDENGSVELYEAYRFTEFDPEKIKKEISGKMKEVSLRHSAVKPETPLKADVILREGEIETLMSELSGDLNYAGVYSRANLHHKGDELQPEGCDRLNLTMSGRIRGSGSSAFFDGDGSALTDTQILRDGKVVSYYGAHRFASYLGEPETGDLHCMKLSPGTLTETELEKSVYIECVSLSGLQVDLYNDYIGGEIRLAYLHENGKVRPVTGITMSAKLSDILGALRLSDTETVHDNYAGPDKLMMRNVTLM